jgi:carboxymethylenebutenolidase
MTDVQIETRRGRMPAYTAEPTQPAPWPGVVVVHDFTRLSHDQRNQADWLAAKVSWPSPPTSSTGAADWAA